MPAALSTSRRPSGAVVLTGGARRSILELREQGFDARRTRDALVGLEDNFRREAEPQRPTDAGAKVPGDAGESLRRCRTLRVRPVDADVHGGNAQIARDVDGSDGDEAQDAWIFHVLTEKGRDFDPNRLGDAVRPSVIVCHASQEAGRGVDDAAERIALDESIDRGEDGLGVASFCGHDTHCELRGLPRVVPRRLGDRDIELVMQTVLEALQHRPLVLERMSGREVQLERAHADDHGCRSTAGLTGGRLEGARHLLRTVALDHVADLDVIEVLDADSALEALAYFAHVFLESPKRRYRAVIDLDSIADHANAPLTVDDATAYGAPSDGADARDLEHLAYLGFAENDLTLLGPQESLERRPHVVHRLVNDAIEANVDTLALGSRSRVVVRSNVEAENDRTRSLREQNIAFGDRANATMDDIDVDLAGRELHERVGERFGRSALVGLEQDA